MESRTLTTAGTVVQRDELFAVLKRQRPKQHGIDDGEDGGVRPKPSASVRTAARVKAGCFLNVRTA